MVQNELESTIYDDAHILMEQKICVKYVKTTRSASLINATLIKRGNKCSASADLVGRHVSFTVIVNSDCNTMSRIQKLIYWSLYMRYEFAKCLGNKQGHIIEKKMANVIKKYNCSFDKSETTTTISEFSVEYSYFSLPKVDGIEPKTLRQIDYSREFSFHEIKDLNKKICQNSCKKSKISCKNYSYKNPKKCNECLCPYFYNGYKCQNFVKSQHPKLCGKGSLTAQRKLSKMSLNLEVGCLYKVKAKNKKRQIKVTFKFDQPVFWDCKIYRNLEIRYRKDKSETGLIPCGNMSKFSVTGSYGGYILIYHPKLYSNRPRKIIMEYYELKTKMSKIYKEKKFKNFAK
uniref:Astacin domain-containing protein n=1 Tax=Strongyloides papillosus TaxID=174720 RepID=A0A0N5CA56_STREA